MAALRCIPGVHYFTIMEDSQMAGEVFYCPGYLFAVCEQEVQIKLCQNVAPKFIDEQTDEQQKLLTGTLPIYRSAKLNRCYRDIGKCIK